MLKKINNHFPGFSAIHGVKNYIKQKTRFWKKDDKYLHRWISVNTFLSVSKAGEWALQNADKFNYPLLIIHGSFDTVTSIESSREFISKVQDNSTLKILDNLCHNIHSEKESKIIFGSIAEWINKQLVY